MTPEELKAKVEMMRELGVSEADGIVLGPPILPPAPEETKEEMLARIAREEERVHRVMFAASGTRPRLRTVR